MKLDSIKKEIPKELFSIINKEVKELRPAQKKAMKKGLLKGKNLLVCTTTATVKKLNARMVNGVRGEVISNNLGTFTDSFSKNILTSFRSAVNCSLVFGIGFKSIIF